MQIIKKYSKICFKKDFRNIIFNLPDWFMIFLPPILLYAYIILINM